MKAQFVQEGASVDYTPGSAVDAGDVVVQGDLVGVAKLDIAANTLGALCISGVFDVLKSTAVFTAGQAVYWDATSELASPDGSVGKLMGIAVEAAATGVSTVRVRLVQDPGQTEVLPPCMVDKTFEDVDDNKTLDAQDVGKVINVTVDAKTITLPAVAAGLEYVIRNGAASGTVAVTVSPNASDKIMGADLAGVDNKDRVNTKATAIIGDYIHLTYGGATGWMVLAERGTWAAEA